jgi:hypothetical protein
MTELMSAQCPNGGEYAGDQETLLWASAFSLVKW